MNLVHWFYTAKLGIIFDMHNILSINLSIKTINNYQVSDIQCIT